MTSQEALAAGAVFLGIEFGSTRIKAVLTDAQHEPIAAGNHEWENRLENGIWTYSTEDIWGGLRDCYKNLKEDVRARYGVTLSRVKAIGISAMMHGYLAFDQDGTLLAPFCTWRNTMTEEAAAELTKEFAFHIPQRWSIAHLYQAMKNGEAHVARLDYLTTLAGYVHWQLTGEKVLGIGDASGMFPIDSAAKDYRTDLLARFDALAEPYGYLWSLRQVLPRVLLAGEPAGTLTAEGARLLDPDGDLVAGISLCPPEGDAGTGMTATDSVRMRTGNVSAGTSVFAMVVLEKPLANVHREIDMVTTPDGEAVAMAHCNNCTSELNAWVKLFGEFADSIGAHTEPDELYGRLFEKALEGDADGGGLLAYNYFSGEGITGFDEGRPLFVRTPDARLTLANFMRVQMFSALGTLKYGLDILLREEHVALERMYGHGGFFKTPKVGQRIMAAAIHAPVSVMKTAGEGGAWGIAVLAAYMAQKKDGESLADYLDARVFCGEAGTTIEPQPEDVAGFDAFLARYSKGLAIERAAVEQLR